MPNINVNAPQIGTKGIYTLLPPYNAILNPNEEYTCQSLRTLTEMSNSGTDPAKSIYLDHALTDVEYKDGLTRGVLIVSLLGSSGQWVNVPANYIAGAPVTDGVPYVVKIIGLSLGPMAVNRDLSNLSTSLSNVVKDQLGIEPEVKIVQVSKTTLVPLLNHNAIETARGLNKVLAPSDKAKVMTVTTTLDQALLKIQALEAYIMANRVKLGI